MADKWEPVKCRFCGRASRLYPSTPSPKRPTCDCLAVRDSLLGSIAGSYAMFYAGTDLPDGKLAAWSMDTAEAIVTERARRDRGGE
jgi:hypothetical protein